MGNREKGRVDLGINQPGYVREGSIILADRWFSYDEDSLYTNIFFFFLILDRIRYNLPSSCKASSEHRNGAWSIISLNIQRKRNF